jgi:hypothetical protein
MCTSSCSGNLQKKKNLGDLSREADVEVLISIKLGEPAAVQYPYLIGQLCKLTAQRWHKLHVAKFHAMAQGVYSKVHAPGC